METQFNMVIIYTHINLYNYQIYWFCTDIKKLKIQILIKEYSSFLCNYQIASYHLNLVLHFLDIKQCSNQSTIYYKSL